MKKLIALVMALALVLGLVLLLTRKAVQKNGR